MIRSHMSKSISEGSKPARSIACFAARTANIEVYSPGAAFRRCLIPVRVVIQSSDVSTIFFQIGICQDAFGIRVSRTDYAGARVCHHFLSWMFLKR